MDIQQLQPNREHTAPIYLQLYQRYREAIATGKLQAGDRVPSVRSLASELNLARGTIEQTYQILVSEGYFVTQGAGGTFVSPQLKQLPTHQQTTNLQTSQQQIKTAQRPILPFELGLPALDTFPRKTWTRLSNHNLRTINSLTYPDAAGYAPLRHAVATYLGISRGIMCTPEQVFITAGYSGALQLICQTVLKQGDVGWYEEPGYILARQFLQHLGMQLQPIPVDADGLNVEIGIQQAKQARFAVVTPTHQSPLGVTLSLARRLALLDWAKQQNAWVIEDDYDSEFRYHGRPLPALKSLDQDGRVLYTGTFSKVLFPGLRLAYLVVPPEQIESFQYSAQMLKAASSILPQATIADFMQQGHFTRHLRKMRHLYATRHDYLTHALAALKHDLHIQPQAGGIHILAHLDVHQDDQAIAQAAQAQGLGIQALSDWYLQSAQKKGLMMGFTNFKTAEEAEVAVKQLSELLR